MKLRTTKVVFALFAGVLLMGGAQTANAAQLTSSQIQAIISLLQSFNADPAVIQSTAAALGGGQVYSGYPTYPTYPNYPVPSYPTPSYPTPTYPYPGQQYPYPYANTEFRLDRTFTLYPGQSAREYRGDLTITLDQIDGYGSYYYSSSSRGDSIRITLGVSCGSGTYCATLWYPQQSFTLDEDETVRYMGYEVTVTDLTRDRATFRVEDDGRDDDDYNDYDDASITVEEPDRGDDVEQGDTLRIEWTVEDRPSDSEIELVLYTEYGHSVGVIAIVDGRSGSYSWRVPTPNLYCTMQYPNGLCGMDLRGDYFIRARLLADTNYNNSYEYDADDSGVFTIER
jgi:hypothetical protein